MADLRTLCIDGDCSAVPEYTAGQNIGITDYVISAPNVYSKTETDALLDGKQDELTPGTNITISNNVISTTAEVNQNAFSNVKVGSTTVAADTKTDTLTLVEGANITLTPNASADSVTIAAPNVYSKTEVDDIVDAINTGRYEVVQSLPSTGEDKVIYLVPNQGSAPNIYDEYVWVNNAFEKIGTTEVDLSNYYTKTQTDNLLDGKQDTLTAGTNITISGNTISATDTKYTNMSQAEANTGTATTARSISAKVLNTTIDNKIAAQPTTSVGSASGWSAGTLPTLGTAIACDDITAWNAGSAPTLGTAIAADDITAWSAGTAANAQAANGVVTFTDGTAPSLSYTARSIPNVTSVGSSPSLTYTARSVPNVTGVGTLPSLTVTDKTVVTP